MINHKLEERLLDLEESLSDEESLELTMMLTGRPGLHQSSFGVEE